MFILGVIPARGGSKGIPGKNIKKLFDRPLIAWSIESAKKSKLLNKFIVSTEDNEIKSVAESYGAEVLTRPVELAEDETLMMDVLHDVMSKIKCDILVLLPPTSPVRDDNLIDDCIKEFINKDADSLATGYLGKYAEYGELAFRRQDIQEKFYDDSNIYIFKTDILKKRERFGDKSIRKIIDREQNVDINEPFDFWLAEQIIKKRVENKNGNNKR